MTAAILGLDCAACVRSTIPPLSPQTTKAPTARNASELDDQFDRDCENEAVLMLLGVNASGAESHREGGEQQRHGEIKRGRGRVRRQPRAVERIDDRQHGRRDRLELERDIGRRPDERDQRGDRGDRLGFAIPRRHKIGDSGYVLRAGEIGDARDEGRSKPDDEDGTDVDRQKIKPVLGGEPDRAVIGPRCAIDGEAQRINDRPRAAGHKASSGAVAPPRDEEQEEDVADGGKKYRRAVHCSEHSPFALSTPHIKA